MELRILGNMCFRVSSKWENEVSKVQEIQRCETRVAVAVLVVQG